MSQANDVLLVVQHRADARHLMDIARRFAHKPNCHAVRVVYEGVADLRTRHIDRTQELKSYVLQAEESVLQEALEQAGVLEGEVESAAVWNPRTWEGVIHAAEACDAGLILKRVEAREGTFNLGVSDDWNLLRHSRVPVLVSAGKDWKETPDIAVAVDVYDAEHGSLNVRILEEAVSLCDAVGGRLHLLSVFPSLSVLMEATPGTTRSIRDEIEREATELLKEFVAASTAEDCSVHVLEGETGDQIAGFCAETHIDLLVVGTKARSGIAGLMLGNTSEQILSKVEVDVMTVPPLDSGS